MIPSLVFGALLLRQVTDGEPCLSGGLVVFLLTQQSNLQFAMLPRFLSSLVRFGRFG